MALPFHIQLNTGDHNKFFTGRSNHNPEMLMFSRIGFHCIFRIGFRVGLAPGIIDGSRIQYFPDLLFRDMTAIHPATGMTGKDEPAMSGTFNSRAV